MAEPRVKGRSPAAGMSLLLTGHTVTKSSEKSRLSWRPELKHFCAVYSTYPEIIVTLVLSSCLSRFVAILNKQTLLYALRHSALFEVIYIGFNDQ